MYKTLDYLITIMVLLLVLCGLVHAGMQRAVFEGTVGGLLAGAVHGPVHVYCLRRKLTSGRPLTAVRVRKIMVALLVTDTVIGLLIGALIATRLMAGA